jgi:hypothetical protein
MLLSGSEVRFAVGKIVSVSHAAQWGQSHATFNAPLSSWHLQLGPSTRVTQAQVGLSAHSASQLHAPPPLAFSSQYQPARQIPVPHLLQVPSSQLGPLDISRVDGTSLADSSSLSPFEEVVAALGSAALPVSSSAADLGSAPVVVPPPH